MHGPVAVVRKGFPLFFVAPKGKVLEHLIEIAEQLRKRGGEIIVLSNSERMRKLAHSYIPIPFEGDEVIMPITSVIGGQLFAYYLAISRGLNPDKPRGLRKVTRIW